jgi:beta-lactamase regulating signal transducer with metallopeptidase domain
MTMTIPDLELVAHASASGLIASLIEGSTVALLAWVFLKVLGRQDSTARFAVWFSALFGIAGISCLGGLFSVPEHAGAEMSAAVFTLPSSWARDIFYLWVTGASVALLRVVIGFAQLFKLRRNCRPLEVGELPVSVVKALQNRTSGRAAKVCVSSQVRVPTAIGFFEPLILIPSWAVAGLSASELESVLIHEFEHLRRRDDWTNLAQKMLGALLFFHPAVWWIESNLALEREMACDDAVLARTENPRAYAACLVTVAEKGLIGRGLALAQAAVSRVQQTTLRVKQILSGDRGHVSRAGKPILYLLATASLAGLLMVSQAPPLVVFRTPAVTMADSLPAASVIPASFKVESSRRFEPKFEPKITAARFVPARVPQAPTHKGKEIAPHRDLVLSASRENSATEEGRVQPVNGPGTLQVPMNAVFVVMHTEQYGDFSRTFWTICVWQVNAPSMGPVNPSKTIPAKSI